MTISVKLRRRKSVVAGKRMSLFFQVTYDRVVKRIVLDLKLSENEWNNESESIYLSPNAGRKRVEYLLNAREEAEKQRKILLDVIETLEDDPDLTTERIVAEYIKRTKPVGWLSYMQQVIERKKPIRSESTINNYKSTLSAFSAFLQGEDMPVNNVDSKVIKAFEKYLLGRKRSLNTLTFYFSNLRMVWNQAVNDGLIEKQPSPFREVSIHIEKTRKRAIDESSIQKLKTQYLEDTSDLSLTRNLFLFCYYARGMAFVDLAHLTLDNIKGNILTYVRRKTGQKIVVELLPNMLDIIHKYQRPGQKYLFPILNTQSPTFKDYTSALRLYNKRLKKLGKMIGCYLTSYVPRHSWASIAYKRGISEEVICESMGHTSLKTTRIYIASLNSERVHQANRVVVLGKPLRKSIFQRL